MGAAHDPRRASIASGQPVPYTWEAQGQGTSGHKKSTGARQGSAASGQPYPGRQCKEGAWRRQGRRGPARPYSAMMCTRRPLGSGGSGGSLSRRPRARLCNRVSNESAAKTGLQLLIAGGARHAHHGPKIREGCRAKGEATWAADQVPEMCLAGYREPREKVVLDAARGVIICKERRSGGWSDSLRQPVSWGPVPLALRITFPDATCHALRLTLRRRRLPHDEGQVLVPDGSPVYSKVTESQNVTPVLTPAAPSLGFFP